MNTILDKMKIKIRSRIIEIEKDDFVMYNGSCYQLCRPFNTNRPFYIDKDYCPRYTVTLGKTHLKQLKLHTLNSNKRNYTGTETTYWKLK